MGKGKKIGIIIVSVIVAIVVVPISASIAYQHDLKVNHPEEYTKLEEKWEQDRLKELEHVTEREQPTEEQIEKNRLAMIAALANHQTPTSFEKFEPATVPSGSLGAERLKYRPYWLVGDEWDEREWLGKISKSQDCVDAVTMINDAKAGELQNIMYRAWVKECVTIP